MTERFCLIYRYNLSRKKLVLEIAISIASQDNTRDLIYSTLRWKSIVLLAIRREYGEVFQIYFIEVINGSSVFNKVYKSDLMH